MPLLPPKAVLAVVAVTDIALNARADARLPPRRWRRATAYHRGISSRCCRRWCATAFSKERADRVAATSLRARKGASRPMIYCAPPARPSKLDCTPVGNTALLKSVVLPVVMQAEEAFSAELARINVEDLAHSAAALGSSAAE
jgi:hypothetical protein